MKLLFSACAEILLSNKITIPVLCSAPRQDGSCQTNPLLCHSYSMPMDRGSVTHTVVICSCHKGNTLASVAPPCVLVLAE